MTTLQLHAIEMTEIQLNRTFGQSVYMHGRVCKSSFLRSNGRDPLVYMPII